MDWMAVRTRVKSSASGRMKKPPPTALTSIRAGMMTMGALTATKMPARTTPFSVESLPAAASPRLPACTPPAASNRNPSAPAETYFMESAAETAPSPVPPRERLALSISRL